MKKNNRQGFSLIEVLIAFFILVFIFGGIVALLTTSLKTWSQTESNKELYDRAQFILDQTANDLRNIYAEIGTRNPTSAPFLGDADRNGRSRLRLVRTGDAAALNVARPLTSLQSPYAFTDLFEVVYLLDPDPRQPILWRGMSYFTGDANSFFFDRNIADKQAPVFANRLYPLDAHVLMMDLEFWAPLTSTWDDRYRVVARGDSKQTMIGPSLFWDSTRRRLDNFVLFVQEKPLPGRPEDPVYPQHVRIQLILGDASPGVSTLKLLQPMDDKQKRVEIDRAERLPQGPAMLRIEQEWCEYEKVQGSAVFLTRRGLRGTSAVSHPTGSVVEFGTEFTTVVTLPVYKDYLLRQSR